MQAAAVFLHFASGVSVDRRRRRHMLARLGLAWLIMMQVMMFAFPAYLRTGPAVLDPSQTLDRAIVLMNWMSLFLTLPVVTYCAWPVWRGAVDRLGDARLSMDVPVALGIIAAFLPSAWATWHGQGPVYFDSVTMFVAFLLTARHFEMAARHSAGEGLLHQDVEQYGRHLSRRADRIAVWFTLIQLVLCAVAGFFWYFHDPSRALGVVVALLVISCPCALAMSVPSAIAAGHAALRLNPGFARSDLYRLMQHAGRIARENLYGSMAWHLMLTPLAMMGWVRPWLAALTMLVSSLAVVLNSWRVVRRPWKS